MEVLIVADGYLPGYKYGGPVRSLAALIDQLGDEIKFSVVTSGSDLDEPRPYPGVDLDTWTRVGKADVWYTQDRRLSPLFWRRFMGTCQPDVIYLNSFMSPVSSAFLAWRRLGILPNIPVILAPRGEFASSALAIKPKKKKVFRSVARLMDLHRTVVFQATSDWEATDIREAMGESVVPYVAPALVSPGTSCESLQPKVAGHARFCWLGRIAPVKNLKGAIRMLSTTSSGNVSLTAYGPIEDAAYWLEVRSLLDGLPDNVTFNHAGEVIHSEVEAKLREHNFFLFPTLGENFGHSIAEALGQGLPVIVSDQTPWRNLERAGVGWDISLEKPEEWARVINHCIAMTDDEYEAMSVRCRGYVEIWMEKHGGRQANFNMFESSIHEEMSS